VKTDEEWRKLLRSQQYQVTGTPPTETPIPECLSENHAKGLLPAASAATTLCIPPTRNSIGTGWPSFWAAYRQRKVFCARDTAFGMSATKVSCRL